MKKQTIIIILLSSAVITLAAILISFVILQNNSKNEKTYSIDGSKMNNTELLEMFKKEDYTISMKQFVSTTYKYHSNPIYIILENEREGIEVQRIIGTLTGTLMTYSDDSINDKYADLLQLSRNDTEQEQEQYEAFLSWLKKYNISKTQLSSMLDLYYENNKDKIKIINEDDFLSQ